MVMAPPRHCHGPPADSPIRRDPAENREAAASALRPAVRAEQGRRLRERPGAYGKDGAAETISRHLVAGSHQWEACRRVG